MSHAKTHPDHHDAELLVRVYELRREAVMRGSRHTMSREFWPRTYADVQALFQPDHPHNAAYRQTSTYWEMVFGMARHGIVHPEYWAEFNGEGLLLFAKIHPFLADLRRDTSPTVFRNAEWVATQTVEGRRLFEVFRARVQKTVEAGA